MKTKYSEALIEQALVKVYARGERTIRAVAQDLNMNHHTLKNWMKRKSMSQPKSLSPREKRPQDWSAEEQLEALQETHKLSGEALQAWCREKGLFAHHLTTWKAAFCAQAKGSTSSAGDIKKYKDENDRLQRELIRKDKALAEAAALLVLQKKFRALWEDEGK